MADNANPRTGPNGWTLLDPETGDTWELGPVSQGSLEGGEEIYSFPHPNGDDLPQVNRKYVMTHTEGNSIDIRIFDDIMGGFKAGKVG
jgi:hypothetical protein